MAIGVSARSAAHLTLAIGCAAAAAFVLMPAAAYLPALAALTVLAATTSG